MAQRFSFKATLGFCMQVAAYEFTTLTCIPGVVHYRGAKIQMLDLPGIIEGAKDGKGRGRQVGLRSCSCCERLHISCIHQYQLFCKQPYTCCKMPLDCCKL